MSTNLELVADKVKQLSVEELLQAQEIITAELRQKNGFRNGHKSHETSDSIFLPTPTPAQIEADLAEIFTPEELAAMFTQDELKDIAKADLGSLSPLPQTLAEMISEDREDRF